MTGGAAGAAAGATSVTTGGSASAAGALELHQPEPAAPVPVPGPRPGPRRLARLSDPSVDSGPEAAAGSPSFGEPPGPRIPPARFQPAAAWPASTALKRPASANFWAAAAWSPLASSSSASRSATTLRVSAGGVNGIAAGAPWAFAARAIAISCKTDSARSDCDGWDHVHPLSLAGLGLGLVQPAQLYELTRFLHHQVVDRQARLIAGRRVPDLVPASQGTGRRGHLVGAVLEDAIRESPALDFQRDPFGQLEVPVADRRARLAQLRLRGASVVNFGGV